MSLPKWVTDFATASIYGTPEPDDSVRSEFDDIRVGDVLHGMCEVLNRLDRTSQRDYINGSPAVDLNYRQGRKRLRDEVWDGNTEEAPIVLSDRDRDLFLSNIVKEPSDD